MFYFAFTAFLIHNIHDMHFCMWCFRIYQNLIIIIHFLYWCNWYVFFCRMQSHVCTKQSTWKHLKPLNSLWQLCSLSNCGIPKSGFMPWSTMLMHSLCKRFIVPSWPTHNTQPSKQWCSPSRIWKKGPRVPQTMGRKIAKVIWDLWFFKILILKKFLTRGHEIGNPLSNWILVHQGGTGWQWDSGGVLPSCLLPRCNHLRGMWHQQLGQRRLACAGVHVGRWNRTFSFTCHHLHV